MNQLEIAADLEEKYQASANEYREVLIFMSSAQVLRKSPDEYEKLKAKLEAAAVACSDKHYALAMHRLRFNPNV